MLVSEHTLLSICHHNTQTYRVLIMLEIVCILFGIYAMQTLQSVVHLEGGHLPHPLIKSCPPPLEIASLQCIATIASELKILYSIQSL